MEMYKSWPAARERLWSREEMGLVMREEIGDLASVHADLQEV